MKRIFFGRTLLSIVVPIMLIIGALFSITGKIYAVSQEMVFYSGRASSEAPNLINGSEISYVIPVVTIPVVPSITVEPTTTPDVISTPTAIIVPVPAVVTAPNLFTTPVSGPVILTNYKSGIPAYNAQLDVVVPPTGFGTGKLWQVGPTREHKKPSSVASLVGDGDVVEIDAATYKCDDSVKWTKSFLTLRGVGGRPILDSSGCSISGGKGIWNPTYQMSNMIVDNIEFMGASVGDKNGAGIRYDGNGYLYITNSYFHDNENGILITPGSLGDIVVDHSEFARNGAGDGYSHNMYISGKVNSFVLRFSYSHDAHIGHEVKSRALTNYILYNRIATEANGDSSYNIDLPQGGLTYIIGNIIQQGAKSPNYGIISYSAEGTHNPIQKVYIAHNTIVNEGISSSNARVVNLYDNALSEAVMANNLIVGVNEVNMVSVTPTKMDLQNNIVTAIPNFYDQPNRIYYLTETSPAVDRAIVLGSAGEMSLTPLYQFVFPASGEARLKVGNSLDIGGYEFNSTKTITPAPKISLSAIKNAVDYNSSATLTWSATNANSCQAGGGWSGNIELSGTYVTQPMTSNQTFSIFCSGTGGTISSSVEITVNDSPQASALGEYVWKEVPDSMINTVSAASLKNASGTLIYTNNFGTGPYTESKGLYATGVYVPEMSRWYLMGGGGGRNYYGNEIYAFNFSTMNAERITDPADISTTKEYYPSDIYGSKVHITGCNGILHLKDGGIAPAARGISGTAGYNPLTKKIVVGPFGVVRGIGNCDGSNAGQHATDMWSFDPATKKWELIAPEDDRFGSVTIGTWFIDPSTGISYNASNRNGSTRGAYLVDNNPESTTKTVIVDNVWPFQVAESGINAVDTINHYVVELGVLPDSTTKTKSPRIAVYDLNGLSMTKYGTGNAKGSTGVGGGSGPLYEPDLSWTFTGETSLLSMADVAITYNQKLQKFVAWAGKDIVYFLTPNYKTKVMDIVSKHVYGNPTSSTGIPHKFTYIPDRDMYLAFVGTDKNFFTLAQGSGLAKNYSEVIPNIVKNTPPPVAEVSPAAVVSTPSVKNSQTGSSKSSKTAKKDPVSKKIKPKAQQITLEAVKMIVGYNERATLTWKTKGVGACKSDFYQSGTLPLSGTYVTEPMIASRNFGILCSAKGKTFSAAVMITVVNPLKKLLH